MLNNRSYDTEMQLIYKDFMIIIRKRKPPSMIESYVIRSYDTEMQLIYNDFMIIMERKPPSMIESYVHVYNSLLHVTERNYDMKR